MSLGDPDHVSAPPPNPLLIFDGNCGFCKKWIQRWRHLTGDHIDYAPYQEAAARFPEIPVENFRRAAHFIEPDGAVTHSARAVYRCLASAGKFPRLLRLYQRSTAFAALSEDAYRFVARHRNGMDRVDRLLLNPLAPEPSYTLTRALFLRLLGLIYLTAFLSLWVQIDGLVGSKGVLPISYLLDQVKIHYGTSRLWLMPTLVWINSSDAFLHFLCAGGTALSLLLIVGVAPALVLFLLWLFYLSLFHAGQVFLGFQWDVLLLETGFLAIFLAPLTWRPRWVWPSPPSRLAIFSLRFLLFKLLLMSGVLKLACGDENWTCFHALRFHYFTQPLPPWTAWYMQHLPDGFQTLSVAFMYLAELAAPAMIFGPRWLRASAALCIAALLTFALDAGSFFPVSSLTIFLCIAVPLLLVFAAALFTPRLLPTSRAWRIIAFWLSIALQLLILATGNYGPFNLLTIALCFLLLDDAALRRLCPWRRSAAPVQSRERRWSPWLLAPITALFLVLGLADVRESFAGYQPCTWPSWFEAVREKTEPFATINSYGLFRIMTTQRPEIILQGSDDGTTWKDYEFKYKPGDITRRPPFVTPHMPRLDWMMWFQAPNPWWYGGWFENLMYRLHEGSPPVVALLQNNPFPDHPPRYVRARLYDYHFSTPDERRRSGAWWQRDDLGPYAPVNPWENQ